MTPSASPYVEAAAHPAAELLACPPEVNKLLSDAAQSLSFVPGDFIFRQSGACLGLYFIIEGRLIRRTDRLATRVTLGAVRPGELVELAAVLGEPRHTFSLVAQSSGSVVLLPLDALHRAFTVHPLLRMQLLEELAREVSRAYYASSVVRGSRTRRTGSA